VKNAQGRIWILLTVLLTFFAGLCAAAGQKALFWSILGVWLFVGFLLAACKPGEKSG
jgi:hypothetical protein